MLFSWLEFCLAPPVPGFRFYTIRYRERNRKWIYQTCPTSETVIDNLKPNTPYEFGVRSNKDDRRGTWSKPVIHNTNMGGKETSDFRNRIVSILNKIWNLSISLHLEFTDKNGKKPYKLRNPLAKPMVGAPW